MKKLIICAVVALLVVAGGQTATLASENFPVAKSYDYEK